MELIAVVLLFVFFLAIRFAVVGLIAWGLDWVLESVLHHQVPYWPVFLGCVLLSFLFAGSSSSKSD